MITKREFERELRIFERINNIDFLDQLDPDIKQEIINEIIEEEEEY